MTDHSPGRADSPGRLPAAAPAGPAGLRAVLFDMDGLLVDSEPLWFAAEVAVMARMGGTWTLADQRHLIGSQLARSVAYMRSRAPRPAPPGQVGSWLVETMVTLITGQGVGLMPGAAELLAEIGRAGLPCALVTSAQRVIMDAVLAATGLRFGATVCAEDVSHGKPDPEPYRRAAALVGEQPRGCVALEDSPTGIAAAEAAGCPLIAVPSVPSPPAQNGRVTVSSLHEVDLALLQEVAARLL